MVWDNFFGTPGISQEVRTKFATLGLDAKIAGATPVSLDVCFFCVFLADCTIVNHHVSPPFGEYVWNLFPASWPFANPIRQKPWDDAVLMYGEAENPPR